MQQRHGYAPREESKIQATEMKLLTVLMGKTKRGIIRNAHTREELRMVAIHNQIGDTD
jgi:hypothetical protein